MHPKPALIGSRRFVKASILRPFLRFDRLVGKRNVD